VHVLNPRSAPPLGLFFARGRQKKKSGPGTPVVRVGGSEYEKGLGSDLFFRYFFVVGVSRQGEFKNTTKIFLQKVHVEKYFQSFDKKFDVSFSSTFFVLSRFRVFFSDGNSKTLQKTFCKKNRVEKFLQKNRPKIQNRFFLKICFITFLGVSR
jgi:hypothetical protein